MSKLPFSVAQQTVRIKTTNDEDAPTVDLFLNVLEADTSKAQLTLLGKDGDDDVVVTFARGGFPLSTEYRAQPEAADGSENEARNARDVERIQKAKADVSKWEEERHSYEGDPRNAPREPDELTKTLARMDVPEDTSDREPTKPSPFGGARLTDGPMRPDEGKPEDDPRRDQPPGDTGDAQRPSGFEPKTGNVVNTTASMAAQQTAETAREQGKVNEPA